VLSKQISSLKSFKNHIASWEAGLLKNFYSSICIDLQKQKSTFVFIPLTAFAPRILNSYGKSLVLDWICYRPKLFQAEES
jgi:hypothetical protein